MRWNFGYHGALNEFFFHTMEFWLSQSLSQIFLSHDGILAIMEPVKNFLSHNGIVATSEPFTIFSHDGAHGTHDLGEDSFHIYDKEYLHRIYHGKNLAS
jgi:hypothetical protein